MNLKNYLPATHIYINVCNEFCFIVISCVYATGSFNGKNGLKQKNIAMCIYEAKTANRIKILGYG